MRKYLMFLIITSTILLSGCGKTKYSLIQYNIAMRDIKVINLEKEEPYRMTPHYRIISENNKIYETTYDLYYDLEKIYNTYKLTNPKEVLTLDGVYNSQDQKINSMSIVPKSN
jgi:hypothetical protein